MRPSPLTLAQLPSDQRRCLRIVSAVPDVAHAARKLHWSQAALNAVLAELQSLLGQAHIRLDAKQVGLSEELKKAILMGETR